MDSTTPIYTTAVIKLISGNPAEKSSEIQWVIEEQKGIFLCAIEQIKDSVKKQLENSGSEILGIIIIDADGINKNIIVPKACYAHRF